MEYANSNDILNGKTAYVNDEKITGTIPSQAGGIIIPGTLSKKACPAGRYTSGQITLKGDANLVAKNIKSGVAIFGIEGNYKGNDSQSGTLPNNMCSISVQSNNPNGGAISGGCVVSKGMTVTIKAIPKTENGYDFYGWKGNGNLLSKEKNYTFEVLGSIDLVALFSKKPIHILPNGYTEVEYIENADSNSLIKTNRSMHINNFSFKFSIGNGWGSSDPRIFESDYSSPYSDSPNYLVPGYNWFYMTTSNQTKVAKIYSGNKPDGVDYNTLSGLYRSSSYSISINSGTSTSVNSSYFGASSVVIPSKKSSHNIPIRIYYFRGEGTLGTKEYTFELIPCTRKDGVVGLYDIVNDEFIQSYGNFITGPVIE